MTRESPWDDHAREQAISLVLADQFRCMSCGTPDAMTEIPRGERHWTWGDGRTFRVRMYRCLACAAEATVRRDFELATEKVEPARGLFHPRDGVRFSALEIEREVSSSDDTP